MVGAGLEGSPNTGGSSCAGWLARLQAHCTQHPLPYTLTLGHTSHPPHMPHVLCLRPHAIQWCPGLLEALEPAGLVPALACICAGPSLKPSPPPHACVTPRCSGSKDAVAAGDPGACWAGASGGHCARPGRPRCRWVMWARCAGSSDRLAINRCHAPPDQCQLVQPLLALHLPPHRMPSDPPFPAAAPLQAHAHSVLQGLLGSTDLPCCKGGS